MQEWLGNDCLNSDFFFDKIVSKWEEKTVDI